MDSVSLVYRRILIKLSGEIFGDQKALCTDVLSNFTHDLIRITQLGVEVGLVLGGGNVLRGNQCTHLGINRITADQIGMLATVINALLLRDQLERQQISARIMSAFPIGNFIKPFERHKAIDYLIKKRIVIFAGGTGNPLVSTDAAASLRAIEIGADVLLKATHVEGIYSSDPNRDPKAILFKTLTYQDVLNKELGVMDLAAFSQCRDHRMPIRIFNMNQPKVLEAIVRGESIGTLVSERAGGLHDD